jgi:hypothetical protein
LFPVSRSFIRFASNAVAVLSKNFQRTSDTLFTLRFSDFYRLSDEVTARWLSEKCPAERLIADEADRHIRFAGEPSYPAISEFAKNGSSPNGKIS